MIGQHAKQTAALGVLTALCAGLVWTRAQQAPPDPAAVKARYEIVAQHLDTGGDLYIVADVDGAVEQAVNGMIATVSAMAASDPSGAETRAMLTKLQGFLSRNGFYAVRGFGMSVVPRPDGLNRFKSFVSLDPAARDLPLWRAMLGGAPRTLKILDFVPGDAAFVRASTGDAARLWQMVRAGVNEIADAKTATSFQQGLDVAAATLGVTLDDLFGSLGEEGLFSIQLSREAKVTFPLQPGSVLSIPEPSLLIGLGIKDKTLENLITQQLTSSGMPVVESVVGDAVLKSLSLPIPSPVPIQPTFATVGDFFLFGTTTKCVADAVQAASKKDGLTASAEFKQAFDGLPMVNNGVTYMSARFGKALTDIQAQVFKATPMPTDEGEAVARAMIRMLQAQGDQSSSMVVGLGAEGIWSKGVSTSGGRQVIASLAAAPIGLLGAIAIPSFVKARETSQRNACINNLRQIDGAKEQWAMAENQPATATPRPEDITDYIKGGWANLRCPAGGTYTINRLGVDPTCSHPRHSLGGPSAAVPAAPAPAQLSAAQRRSICINHLRQIDGAKEQWAMAENMPADAVPTPEDISPYIKGGFHSLKCPDGGKYRIFPLGVDPTCSHPGHEL